MEGMLSPELKEEITGTAEIRETFKISKVGTIAGCMITDGKVFRNSKIRLIREGVARARRAETGAAPVLLLDEVAAHLDPARRAALFDEITALGAQALMTGTGAALFDSLGSRGQSFTVADAGDGLSLVHE